MAVQAPAVAQAQDTGEVNPVRAEPMVLRVSLNTTDKGDRFVGHSADGDFLLKDRDLQELGFADPLPGTAITMDDEGYRSLKSIRGVTYSFDARRLTLAITADPKLLALRRIGGPRGLGRGFVPRENSGFFNYALDYFHGSAAANGAWTATAEAGWRQGDYLFVTNGATLQSPDNARKFVRLMSNATRDDRESLRRWLVGDFFTPSRELSGGANLGGFSVSKLYALNPYLVQFPTQTISGQVALPSQVDVYMDGQKIRTENISPGQFQLDGLLAYGGASNVQVVMRDAFGRVQTLDYSFYFSDRALQQGLQEYSYNAGAIRRGYGLESSRYGPPAFSMFHRYGFTDALTFGFRAEALAGFWNSGPSATIAIGPWGVLSLAAAASSVGHLRGTAASAGYNYQAARWNLGFTLRRDWRSFAVLGDPPTVTNRKFEGNVTWGLNLPGQGGAITLSHSVLGVDSKRTAAPSDSSRPFTFIALDDRRVSSVSYSRSLIPGRVSLTASLTHTQDKGSRTDAFIGLSFFIGRDYVAAANVHREGNRNSEDLQLTRNQPIGEGLGYQITTGRSADAAGSSTRLLAQAQYNAPLAILRAEYDTLRSQQGQQSSTQRLSVAGGVAYVNGETALGRPLVDGFGIVKVGELPGVKVMVGGQDIGRTDGEGKLLVPTLNSYYDNEISIAAETVPIEYQLSATSRKISPSARGGTVIEFAATRLQAFSGVLKYRSASGETLPVVYQEVLVRAGDRTLAFQTGKAGEFYLENLAPGTYSTKVLAGSTPCTFDIVIPESAEIFVELPEIVCRLKP